MSTIISVSVANTLAKRVSDLPKGERSKIISELLQKYFNDVDGVTAIQELKRKWFLKTVRPAVLEYANGQDLFPLRDSPRLHKHLNDSGIEISELDMRACVDEMMHEEEQNGRE